MTQAIVDPDELRQFARSLKKFNSEIRDKLARLNHELQSLGSTWRDQEHKRFTQQYEEHTKIVLRFLEMSDQHIPYLVRKADQIDEYLRS
jgi:WXG100 family type VII secretion target